MKTLTVLEPGWEKLPDIWLDATYGLTISKSKVVTMPINFWEEFYLEHTRTLYWNDSAKYLSSSPSVIFILEGDEAVEKAKRLVAKTRKKYGVTLNGTGNVASTSNSEEAAKKQIELFKKFCFIKMGCET